MLCASTARKTSFSDDQIRIVTQKLLHEGTCTPEQFFSPKPIAKNTVLRVHDPEYYEQLCALTLSKAEVRGLGFPLSKALVYREHVIAQGTIDGAEHALTIWDCDEYSWGDTPCVCRPV